MWNMIACPCAASGEETQAVADTLAPGDLERTADEDGSAAHRERSKIVQIALLQPTHSHTMQLRPSARTDAPHRPPRAHTRYSTSLHMNDEREAQRRAVKSAPLSGSPFPHHDYFLLLCHHALADSPPAQDHHAPCHASRLTAWSRGSRSGSSARCSDSHPPAERRYSGAAA